MIIVIYLVLFTAGLFKKKSPVVFWLILIFMWAVATFSYGTADETVYLARYHTPNKFVSTELFYKEFILLCKHVGFSFVGFKGVSFIIMISLIGITVWKFATYPNLVMILFFVCPFPMYVTQMRGGLATAVFIFGLRYLFQEEDITKISNAKTKLDTNDIKYIICILIASFIHTQSIIWLVLLIAKKLTIKANILFVFVLNILLLFVITPENVYKFVSLFGAGGRIGAYVTSEYASSDWRHYGVIITVFFVAGITIFMCLYVLKKQKAYSVNVQGIELLLKMNISILCILALIIRYTSEAYRLQDGLTVINYMFLTNVIRKEKNTFLKVSVSNLKVITLILVYYFVFLWLLILHYLVPTVWAPFWLNNTLFGT